MANIRFMEKAQLWKGADGRMAEPLKLPIGVDNFEKIRKDSFYYVDKTGLIEQLLERWGEVNLFTRPRRFGKTLNMSMLRSFFEIGTDPLLFDGLYICGYHSGNRGSGCRHYYRIEVFERDCWNGKSL